MILCTTKNSVGSFYFIPNPGVKSGIYYCLGHYIMFFFVIGVKEIYTSWTIGAAARFLCQYASCMKERYAVIGTYAALFLQTSCKLKMGVDF